MLQDMRMLGFPESAIDEARAEMAAHWGAPPEAFAIHPENGRAFRLFLAMASQWRSASLNTAGKALVVRTGLDYGAMPIVAQQLGMTFPLAEQDFDRLRVLEAEALGAWREDREASGR